uniref:Protein c-Fos n=1 Tax=Cynoglossus semilaevis TaxID=244447 RepID=A0A3P8X1M2_CYNSE
MMFTGFNAECDSSSRCSTASPSGDNMGYYPSPAGSYSSMGSPQSQEFTDLTATSASFIPTVTAISTSPDLQWMVQPLVSSVAPSHRAPPYSSSSTYSRPGMRSAASKGHSSIKRGRVEQVITPLRKRGKESAERETSRLQPNAATGDESLLTLSTLTFNNDIANLMKEKERLEFILAAHQPICKIPSEQDSSFPGASISPVHCFTSEVSSQSQTSIAPTSSQATFTSTSNSIFSSCSSALSTATVSGSTVKLTDLDASVLEESLDLLVKTEMETARSVPEVDLSNSLYTTQDWEPLHASTSNNDFEPLCTPVVTCTPSCTTFTSTFAFTFPEAETHATCGIAHRRGSSSNDQSSDSLSSPTLLAL